MSFRSNIIVKPSASKQLVITLDDGTVKTETLRYTGTYSGRGDIAFRNAIRATDSKNAVKANQSYKKDGFKPETHSGGTFGVAAVRAFDNMGPNADDDTIVLVAIDDDTNKNKNKNK